MAGEREKVIGINIEVENNFPVFPTVNQCVGFFNTTGNNDWHQFYLILKTEKQNKS